MRAWAVVAGLLLQASTLTAQDAERALPTPRRFEVAVSAGLWGGAALGTVTPTLSGPQLPTGTAVPYFTADASIEQGAAAELRIGWRLWHERGLYAEATGGIGRNRMRVSIRNDIEQAPASEAATSVTQFAIEGGVALEPRRLRLAGGRLRPFLSAGGGYLRQLYEDRVLAETGRTVYAGGGVKWRAWPVPQRRRFVDRLGLRSDVRVVWREGGADIAEAWRPTIAATGGLIVQF